MKERPILFSGPMVRALLEGRKTMTRRVVKPQPPHSCTYTINGAYSHALCRGPNGEYVPPAGTSIDHRLPCPYGVPGDQLWVKETCWIAPKGFGVADVGTCTDRDEDRRVVGYSASMCGDSVRCAKDYGVKQSPSIHMPRWASRLTLEVTEVRVERLQEISEADAIAEGAPEVSCDTHSAIHEHPVEDFRDLWDSINAKRGFGWDTNCWVWVVAFKPV